MATLKTALLGAVLLAACDKNAVQIGDITAPVTGARVKFFNFGINAPGVNFYAGDQKITAISSTTGVESTTGTTYGGVGLGGFYSELKAGTYVFNGRIAATVDKDLQVAKINGTVEAGKAYSVYMSGFYDATAKSVEGFMVPDVFPDTFDFTRTYVRFVNASPNSQPMLLSFAAAGVEAPPFPPMPYKGYSVFAPGTGGVYDLILRTQGSTTVAVTRTGVSFLAGRYYTVTLRGDMTVSSTGTATNRPFLDVTLNR